MFHCPYGRLHFEKERGIVLLESLEFAAGIGDGDVFAGCIGLGQNCADSAWVVWSSGGGVNNN